MLAPPEMPGLQGLELRQPRLIAEQPLLGQRLRRFVVEEQLLRGRMVALEPRPGVEVVGLGRLMAEHRMRRFQSVQLALRR